MVLRNLLKVLLGLLAPGAVSQALANTSNSGEPQKQARQLILLQASPVAGFQYHEGEHLWATLQQGDVL